MQSFGNENDVLNLEPLNYHDLEQIRDSSFEFGSKKETNERGKPNGLPSNFDYSQLAAFKVPTTQSPLPPISPLNPQVDFGDFSAIAGQHAFDMNNLGMSSPPTPSGAMTPVNLPTPDIVNMNHFNNLSHMQHPHRDLLVEKQTQQIKNQQHRIQQLEAMLHPSQVPFVPNQVPSPAPQWFNSLATTPTPFDQGLGRPMTPDITLQPQKYPSSNTFNMNPMQQNHAPGHPFAAAAQHLSSLSPKPSSPSDWLTIPKTLKHHSQQQQVNTNHPSSMNNVDNKIGPGKKDGKVKKKRKYDWDVYQLKDYADALLSMMPRTVFSRHREKNNSKSSWYTYNVKAGMYVREQSDTLQSFHVLPPRNLSHDEFYRRFNSKYQELINNGKEFNMHNEKPNFEREEIIESMEKEEESQEKEEEQGEKQKEEEEPQEPKDETKI